VPSYSSLDAVSSAIYAALNVSALLALAPGGVGDDIAQLTAYPCVLYEVAEAPMHGYGTKPGTGRTLEISLRLYVYSQYAGMAQAQQVMAKAIQLLADAPAVTGYGSWAIFHDETIPVGAELIAGVQVNELAANFRLYITEVP
jgi:hypothetical protein